MNRSLRFGTALSALAMAGLLTGCATGQRRQYAKASSAAAASKIGLATRAQMALAAGDFASAVSLAEQAVAHSPNQAAFRMVLGNAYFAAGRFASAEAAYRDSLSLAANPDVVLKLALARIAQGKNAQALADLEAARDHLEAADYGLALALAGQPADAVAVLGQAARLPGADARLRQNLALAHALSGDWTMARTIAAQDVGPDQLDSRIQQWMVMATPTRASDQVAALTGVTPSIDPGQPVHLALNQAPAAPRTAQAAPVPQPVAAPVEYAAPEPAEYVEPQVAAFAEAEPQPESVAQVLIQPAVEPSAPVDPLPTEFQAKPEAPKFIAVAARKPARANGRSTSVVQLGAYGSPKRVAAAWNQFARRYGALGRYTPVSARFSGPNGTVYRLSVKGFASASEAQRLCSALQRKGGNCFVRRVAGDAPVQLASR